MEYLTQNELESIVKELESKQSLDYVDYKGDWYRLLDYEITYHKHIDEIKVRMIGKDLMINKLIFKPIN